MFTGLITDVGRVRSVEKRGDLRVVFDTAYDMASVDYGASIACNGVCLTVVDKADGWFAADISDASCDVTTCGLWAEGTLVNLERSLKLGDELGGHIVSGHVDCVGEIVLFEDLGDSTALELLVPKGAGAMLAAKGSVAIDGVSLTVNAVRDGGAGTVSALNIIPHTKSMTAFRAMTAGQRVNVEFDVLARYVARLHAYGSQKDA